jgi:hypothetical protein
MGVGQGRRATIRRVTADNRTPDGWSAQCLAHLLRDDERADFERDGYIIVEDALPPDLLRGLRTQADQELAAFRRMPDVTRHHVLNLHDLIGRDDAYLPLVDLPSVFPKVWGILGWHIQVFHSQLIVTPPAPEGARPGAYGWHQDNNRMNLDLDGDVQPRISVKVGFFLSDLPRPGMGNLCVVPGSQRDGRPHIGADEQPPGTCELTVRSGDAVIFDRRLWHAASTNCSASARQFLTVGYSYRWLRAKSAMCLDELLESLPPIRRQLLGATTAPNAWFDPSDADVPLRAWITEHVGTDALAP